MKHSHLRCIDNSGDEGDPLALLPDLHAQAVSVAHAAKQLDSVLAQLTDAMGRSKVGRAADPSVRRLESADETDRQVAETVDGCRLELLTVQPGGSPADTLQVAWQRDRRALERGARMRSLYQHTARHDATTATYVKEIADAGAEVRTFDEFFGWLIIVDRRVAFLPASTDSAAAAMVTDPAMVRYLVKVFEHIWDRADPFVAHTTHNITTPMQDLMVRMLVDGMTGSVIAKRLGISERTLAKRLAKLKKEYGAQTHFQLGYRLAHRHNPGVQDIATKIRRAPV